MLKSAVLSGLRRSAQAGLKLLLIAGCRMNEFAGMRRAELSEDCAT